MEKGLLLFFRVIGVTISFCVWGVFGLTIWLFLMVRHFAVLALLSTLIAFGHVNIDKAVANMERAVSFYPSGFNRIFNAFFQHSKEMPRYTEFWSPIWRAIAESYAALTFFWLPVSLVADSPTLSRYLALAFLPFVLLFKLLEPYLPAFVRDF